MSEILNDDAAKANPRAASTRIKSNTAKRFSGQIRHDLRRGNQPKNIDDERSHLNRVLLQPPTPAKLRKICEQRRALRGTQRKIKSNAAVATIGVITFGSEAAQMFEALSQKDQDRAFKLLSRAIARKLNTSLHGLVVHMDEATIHAHYTLAAYDREGHPLSKSTRPQIMSELQDLTAKVMQRFDPRIERGRRYGDRLAAGADWSDVINKSVKELHRTLPADLAKKRDELAEIESAVAATQARVDEMQARVTKLEEKESLTEREVKRLETYQRRLDNRTAELADAQAQAEAARLDADRLAGIASRKREAEEEKAAEIAAESDAEVARKEAKIEAAANRHLREVNEVRAEAAAELDDLEQREAALELKQSRLTKFAARMTQVVRDVFGALNLPMPAKLTDAVQQLECEIAERKPELEDPFSGPAENPVDDTSGPGF